MPFLAGCSLALCFVFGVFLGAAGGAGNFPENTLHFWRCCGLGVMGRNTPKQFWGYGVVYPEINLTAISLILAEILILGLGVASPGISMLQFVDACGILLHVHAFARVHAQEEEMQDRATLSVPRDLMAKARAKAVLDRVPGGVSAVVRLWLDAWVNGRIPTPQEKGQLKLEGFGDEKSSA